MDDFLHNLRSGKLKQPDRSRREYTDYKGPQRRAGHERRRTDYYAKVTNENFSLIKETLDVLAEHQQRIAAAATATQKSEARIADALEAIVVMMGRRWGYEDLASGRSDTAEAPTAKAEGSYGVHDEPTDGHPAEKPSSPGSGGSKPAGLLGTIEAMRNEGDSWEKIARHFEDQGIQTVSGKGKWRGTAVKKFWDSQVQNART
jgi:hypothetical protein